MDIHDRMSFQAPLKRVRNCFAFNYMEYDPSMPSIVEGRVHPIQFANSITRINVAARAHRDKSLYLLLLFLLGILVLSIYPFMDLTYYLYIVLIFAPLSIIEYIGFSFLQTRTTKLLRVAVDLENEVFVTNGMRLIWEDQSKQIIIEVIRRVSLAYENPMLVQEAVRDQEMRYSGETSSSSFTSTRPSSSLSSFSSTRRSSLIPADHEQVPLLNPLPSGAEIEVDDVLHHHHPPSYLSPSRNPNHVQIRVE